MTDTPRHLPADERRAVTVQTVIELAAEQNPSEITTAAIASRMGLTQGALFRHFPTKDAILQSVMEWVADRLLARVNRSLQEASSPLAALEAAFMAHVMFVSEHPGVPRVLFAELQRREGSPAKLAVQALLGRYSERLAAIVETGKAKGEITTDLPTHAIVLMFIGTIQGLVMRSLLAGDVGSIARDAPATFEVLRRGIRSTP